MSNTTSTFTIHPALVMSLTRGIIRDGWEVDQDGKTLPGNPKTLNEAKAKVRRLLPEGTRLAWRKDSIGRWYTTAEVPNA